MVFYPALIPTNHIMQIFFLTVNSMKPRNPSPFGEPATPPFHCVAPFGTKELVHVHWGWRQAPLMSRVHTERQESAGQSHSWKQILTDVSLATLTKAAAVNWLCGKYLQRWEDVCRSYNSSHGCSAYWLLRLSGEASMGHWQHSCFCRWTCSS